MPSTITIILSVALFLNVGCTHTPDSSQSQAQQANATTLGHYPNLRLQAIQLTDATLRGDYETVQKLTYPKLIELGGGPESFRKTVRETVKEIESKGIKIESLSVGEPQDFMEAEQRIYAIVPTKMKLRVPEGLLVGDAFLIGISEDKGANWTFVDSTGAADKQLRKMLFPTVADKLRLPEQKRPVLQKEPS